MPTGGLGSALAITLINNALFAANAQLVASAVALGRELDVSPEAVLSALAVCSGGSSAAAYMQGMGGVRTWPHSNRPPQNADSISG